MSIEKFFSQVHKETICYSGVVRLWKGVKVKGPKIQNWFLPFASAS